MNYTKLSGFTDEAADSIAEQIRVLLNLGWSGMELRTIDGRQLMDLSDYEFCKVRDAISDADIEVVSVGSCIADWSQSILRPFEETKILVRRFLPKIKALGASFVRIMSYQILEDKDGKIAPEQFESERIRRIDWIAKTFLDNGIQPLHENCSTYGGLSYEHALRLLEKVPELRLVFDTGNPPINVDCRTEFPYFFSEFLGFLQQCEAFHISCPYQG